MTEEKINNPIYTCKCCGELRGVMGPNDCDPVYVCEDCGHVWPIIEDWMVCHE